jgi:3-hydroxyanthranilate 3,4-dioxygenase
MATKSPFNLRQWIEENRHLLKPPVGNQNLYKDAGDFIVMIVGGPNSRKDFHYNQTEELFYQLQGDVSVKIHEDGKIREIPIKEGDIFLLPGKVPHSPQRGANTIGLVIEKKRDASEEDAFMWFCEQCGNKLHEQNMNVSDIVAQLPPVMKSFYESVEKRTCKSCGAVMEPPPPVA